MLTYTCKRGALDFFLLPSPGTMCFKKDGVKKKESDGLENGLATQSAGLFFLRRWLITICVSSSRDSNTSSESYMHKVNVPLCG